MTRIQSGNVALDLFTTRESALMELDSPPEHRGIGSVLVLTVGFDADGYVWEAHGFKSIEADGSECGQPRDDE